MKHFVTFDFGREAVTFPISIIGSKADYRDVDPGDLSPDGHSKVLYEVFIPGTDFHKHPITYFTDEDMAVKACDAINKWIEEHTETLVIDL